MKYIAKAASVLFGASILALVVLAWSLATNGIASYIERAWCWNVGPSADCHFRGVWTFLVWCIVGIINILIAGFLFERIGENRNRRR